MKKETKRVNKKLLVLSLILLSLMVINIIAIAAEDYSSTSSEPSFFQRWVTSSFKNVDAKLLLWLMMFVVLLVLLQALGLGMGSALLISIPFSFILVAYVTPESIIGVFRSYQTLPLAFATFLPLAILFGLTYLSVIKGSRTLMTTQWLLWLIYGIFNLMKIILAYWVYNNGVYSDYFRQVVNLPADFSAPESFWFWMATIVAVGVAWAMVVMGGKFMNWAVLRTTGMEDAAAKKRFTEASDALKNLSDIEKNLANAK